MSNLTYNAIITLTPPEANGKVTITVKLHDSDTIHAGGVRKPLGQCTLAELCIFADELEAQLGSTYRDVQLAQLVEKNQLDVEVDADNNDWLNDIVILDAVVEDAPAQNGVADLPAVEDEIIDVEIVEIEPPQPDQSVVEEINMVEDVVEQADEFEEAVEVEEVVDEEQTEEVSAETPPTPAAETESTVNVEEPEDIFEERETTTPLSTDEVAATTESRTAGKLTNRKHNNLVDILIDEGPLRRMQEHASSSLRLEVAGMMLGPLPEKQPNGRYVVHVTDMIVAKYTKMSGASVTYTPESWRYMNDKLREMYPDGDVVMVGWYHTHPGFGIFLSNMDLFIHTNFFTQKWHIAYVLDPVAQRSGFFSWNRTQSRVIPYDFPWPRWAARSW